MRHRTSSIWSFLALASLALTQNASAESIDPQSVATRAAAVFGEVCFGKAERLDAIVKEAKAKKWKSLDPKALLVNDVLFVRPGQKPQFRSSERTAAWRVLVEGQELTVAIKEAERFNHPSCEVSAISKKRNAASMRISIVNAIEGFGGGNVVTQMQVKDPIEFPDRVTTKFRQQGSQGMIFYVMINEGDNVVHHMTQFGDRKR